MLTGTAPAGSGPELTATIIKAVKVKKDWGDLDEVLLWDIRALMQLAKGSKGVLSLGMHGGACILDRAIQHLNRFRDREQGQQTRGHESEEARKVSNGEQAI